jgi:LuxR family quorum-sensing system transcriptional regulator CciR
MSMTRHIDFDKFIDAMRQARDMADLEAVMTEVTRVLGFERFAMGHHVDLVRPPDGAIRLTNYDPEWIEQSLGDELFIVDPIHQMSARAERPFQWSEVEQRLRLTDEQRQILERAKPYGLVAGLTVPVNLPGEYQGSCSFAAPDFDRLHPYAFPLCQYVTGFGFECARRLLRLQDGRGPPPVPHFTPKQKETLILVGRGKTDTEIGAVLGISRTTAHDHVEASRRAYGNAQRSYMVVRAVYDGVITFADLFRR